MPPEIRHVLTAKDAITGRLGEMVLDVDKHIGMEHDPVQIGPGLAPASSPDGSVHDHEIQPQKFPPVQVFGFPFFLFPGSA